MTEMNQIGGNTDYFQSATLNKDEYATTGTDATNQLALCNDVLEKDGSSLRDILLTLQALKEKGFLSEKPKLEQAHIGNISNEQLKNMGIEAIMMLLNDENRTASLQATKSSLQIDQAERSKIAQDKINKLEEQCKKIEEQQNVSTISKIFKVLGAICNLLVGLGSIALACSSGNIVMALGGILSTIAAIDQIMDLSTNGQTSLTSLMAKGLTSLGVSEDVAQIVASCVMLAVSLAGAFMSGVSCGGSSIILTVTDILSGMLQIASGTTNIFVAIDNHDLACIQADTKHLQAMLERLQLFQESAMELLKALMEQKEDMIQAVSEVVNDCNESLKNIVNISQGTGGALMA